MSRLCVKFFPSASASLTNPQPILVYRGNPPTFANLWQACAEKLPAELLHPQANGHIFVGRESDAWIKDPSRSSPAAKLWSGTMKSGSFHDFLCRETALYFKNETEAETVS